MQFWCTCTLQECFFYSTAVQTCYIWLDYIYFTALVTKADDNSYKKYNQSIIHNHELWGFIIDYPPGKW